MPRIVIEKAIADRMDGYDYQSGSIWREFPFPPLRVFKSFWFFVSECEKEW